MASNPNSAPSGISEVKLSELPQYFQRLQLKKLPSGFMAMILRYQQKYIMCKNGKMTPFFHAAGLCVLINYWIEYKHLKRVQYIRHFASKIPVCGGNTIKLWHYRTDHH